MQQTIVITGADGQLGEALQKSIGEHPNEEYTFLFTDKSTFDITNDETYAAYAETKNVFAIINCAAYTQVDKAEEDKEAAHLLNAKAVEKLTNWAKKQDAYLFHVSTDYVFNGKEHRPYTEASETKPASVYGKTKRAGEEVVLSYNKGCVVRTSWLYSVTGNNFVKTMLRLGNERNTLNVIDDQVGSPTCAMDLAAALLDLLAQARVLSLPTTFHFSNEGVCSWYDFAHSIMKIGQVNCRVMPIPSEEFPTKAPRPSYSVMSKRKIRAFLKKPIPHWLESLQETIRELQKE